jgi:hypothetical protein
MKVCAGVSLSLRSRRLDGLRSRRQLRWPPHPPGGGGEASSLAGLSALRRPALRAPLRLLEFARWDTPPPTFRATTPAA